LRRLNALVWELLYCDGMIAITGKVMKNGRTTVEKVLIPANHSEARGGATSLWGLVIAGALLLFTTTLICLLLFAA
jgi:hypothetical protein